MVDYSDEAVLQKFAMESVGVAEKYAEARQNFAQAKINLDKALAEAYRDQKIKDSMAYDKALIALTINDEGLKADYEILVTAEQEYKGLEAVLSARQSYISLWQSLVKNRAQQNA